MGQWKNAASPLVGKQRHWRLKGGGSLLSLAGILYSSIYGMDKDKPERPPDCPEFSLGNAEFVVAMPA